MVNPNKKVKRPDGLGKIYRYKTFKDNIVTLPILELLEDNYIYLYRAIRKENFHISITDSCYFFKEILYDNEVVGFAAYNGSGINEEILIMQHIYILPGYRNKGLVIEELDEAQVLFESTVLIEYPNRFIVESLIKHKLARVFDDRYAISRIPFIMPAVSMEDATSGVLREEYDSTDKKGYKKLSLIYDLELCAVVGLASNAGNNVYNGEDIDDAGDLDKYNMISLPLRIDDENFDCVNKRKNNQELVDGAYFNQLSKLVESQDDVIQNWLSIL